MQLKKSLLIGFLSVLSGAFTSCEKPKAGCIDPSFENFDPEATIDNGCCCNGERTPSEVSEFVEFPYTNISEDVLGNFELPKLQIFYSFQREKYSLTGPCGCQFAIDNRVPPEGTFFPREMCRDAARISVGFGISSGYPQDLQDAIFAQYSSTPRVRVTFEIHFMNSEGDSLILPITAIVESNMVNDQGYIQIPIDPLCETYSTSDVVLATATVELL